ncbi:MAG: 4-alpha-glucanotransferase [Candidatus Dadabacteria bacterium RIFCSPHIGHO2_12_FULL_53_21]|nr:MAG: 4-alpha-glucanotransferase [Candidatus Dadabacteria bacterium RIFCSPHIGHO2_12_FULL_53_21]
MNKRASGILLHITSLPSLFGIGDMGPESYRFADFLAEARQSYWQVLPINPTDNTFGNSPYSGPSSYAGNPLLISPEMIKDAGYLCAADMNMETTPKPERVDYGLVTGFKTALLYSAFKNAETHLPGDSGFMEFSRENEHWLEDYALYASVKKILNCSTWRDFPADLRDRDEKSLEFWRDKAGSEVLYHKFLQYIFFSQWSSLKKYANGSGIEIIGDIPYYINYDSSEVWTHPELFKLDEDKNPAFVSGVPPDYFSKTGQLWGNPVYDWEALKATDFEWWIKRIGHNLKLFDYLRLDHFRGFVSYWEVKASEKTALKGRWVDLDAASFFDTLFSHFDKSRFIAEDLGYITPDVNKIIKKYALPGMKILLFAFGNDFPYGSYLPKNFSDKNCVVYTGTHDNNTVLGWWTDDAGKNRKKKFFKYIGGEIDDRDLNWEFVKLAMSSIADTAIIPMQDILGLGADAKMNRPSTKSGNWEWRLTPGCYKDELVTKLKEITEANNRGELSG